MTRENLITVSVGTTLDTARESTPPSAQGGKAAGGRPRLLRLKGLITVKDIQKAVKYPNASKGTCGCLRCGAAVGVARTRSIAPKLIRITPAGVRESHVHDVAITRKPLNHRSE